VFVEIEVLVLEQRDMYEEIANACIRGALVTLGGREGVLAHEKIKGPVRVGIYGVNLEDLDRIAVPAMIPSKPGQIVFMDEIGKMECLSPLFRETLVRTLDSPHKVLGSISLKGGPFI